MSSQKGIFSSGTANSDEFNADKTVYIPKPGATTGESPLPASPPINTPNLNPSVNSNHLERQVNLNHSIGYDQSIGYNSNNGNPHDINQNIEINHDNPIIRAASTLLRVITRLRHTAHHQHIQVLHQNLVRSIKTFDLEIKNQQIRPEIALSARYMLCSAVDECVLNTPWGSQSQWSRHSLLSVFHKETFGGEKFYLILSRMLEAPAKNVALLELAYLLLSLGFEGKYKVDPRGRDKIENIRDRLFTSIEQIRGEFSSELAPDAIKPIASGKKLTDYIPLWVITLCAFALMLLCYGGFKLWLHETAALTSEHIQSLSTELDETSQLHSRPTEKPIKNDFEDSILNTIEANTDSTGQLDK